MSEGGRMPLAPALSQEYCLLLGLGHCQVHNAREIRTRVVTGEAESSA